MACQIGTRLLLRLCFLSGDFFCLSLGLGDACAVMGGTKSGRSAKNSKEIVFSSPALLAKKKKLAIINETSMER